MARLGVEDRAAHGLVGADELRQVAPDRVADRVGVEADVEPREMQPERAHLTQQVLHGAVRDRRAAGGVADQLEVVLELLGGAVGERAVGGSPVTSSRSEM